MNRRAFLAIAAASSVVGASTMQRARAQTTGPFSTAARYSAERDGASFLIVRHGIVLAEEYPAGDENSRWPIGAGTKSFISLLAGTLVEDRLMTLDEPAAMTLGDWGAHPVKFSITIRALLSGTSALMFPRNAQRDLPTALALEPVDNPGAVFIDDAASYMLLTEIARRKLEARGREPDPARYLTERTLAPIGCVPIGWARGEGGSVRFDDGAAVSARGWAQAGELIRRAGVWRAQELADSNVMLEAMRGSFAEARAGFGLWLAAPGRTRDAPPVETDLWRGSSPAPIDLAMAAGAGGQRLYLCPSEGLVIVRQSRSNDARGWSDAQFLSAIWRDL
jgi:CubicO group peptidase (beta-lactamase class C family)